VFVRDLVRGTETRLTLGGGQARMPFWSPDGRRFACIVEDRPDRSTLLVASADGLGRRDTTGLPGGSGWMLNQWSAVLGRLVLTPANFAGAYQVHPESAGVAPRVIPGLDHLMGQSSISPDGRWVAYVTNEGGGTPQIYVQSLTGTPGRWQISTTGGLWPTWTRRGNELLFEGEGSVMAVDIDTREGFRPGTPHPLFSLSGGGGGVTSRSWNCTADGERFFVLSAPNTVPTGSIEVVTDFAALVNRK